MCSSSWSVRGRLTRAGEPRASTRGGIWVPGVTTLPAATIVSLPITAWSSTMAPMPIRHRSEMVQACRTTRCPTVTRAPIRVPNRLLATWMTERSWMLVSSPISIRCSSQRTTQPYQMLARSPRTTSPATVAVGAMKTSRPSRGVRPLTVWIIRPSPAGRPRAAQPPPPPQAGAGHVHRGGIRRAHADDLRIEALQRVGDAGVLRLESRGAPRQLLPLIALLLERRERGGETQLGHFVGFRLHALAERVVLAGEAQVLLGREELAHVPLAPGQVAAGCPQRGDGLFRLAEDFLHHLRRDAQLGQDLVADPVHAGIARVQLGRRTRGGRAGPGAQGHASERRGPVPQRTEPLRAGPGLVVDGLLRRGRAAAHRHGRVDGHRCLGDAGVPRDHARAAAAEPRGREDEPPQERQRAQRHDEQHDRAQEPQVALEEARVGDARLAFGAPAQLALQAALPPLASPVGIRGAQALGPIADHLLLLRAAAGDGLLGAAQARLELLLPVWDVRVAQGDFGSGRGPGFLTWSGPFRTQGMSSAATRPRSSTDLTTSTRVQWRE